MSMITIAVLLFGALAGGFVSGLAGFGTALMALGIWLYVVTPDVAVQLVLICSIIAQTWTMPSIWRSIDFRLVLPFLAGGLAGVPIGTWLVAYADPRLFKLTFGVFLLVFPAALYLQRKPTALKIGGWAADTGVGFAGGVLGGLAGLSGPIPILWASMRGFGKDERRGLFQTFNWTILTAAFVVQAGSGLVTRQTMWLAFLVLPATVGGAWLGTRTYHALSDGNFRDIVLGLLFVSGVTLVWSSVGQPL